MGTEPLKKELESIDQELESAMLRLTETTQRVDELLADYTSTEGGERKPPGMLSLRAVEGESAEEAEEVSAAPQALEADDDQGEA